MWAWVVLIPKTGQADDGDDGDQVTLSKLEFVLMRNYYLSLQWNWNRSDGSFICNNIELSQGARFSRRKSSNAQVSN